MSATMSTADVKPFFDEATFTVSYVVSDPATQRAAIIESAGLGSSLLITHI
jgi:hypothetical protein